MPPSSRGAAAERSWADRGLSAAREVLDELRSPGPRRRSVDPQREDVRAAVLLVLAEGPSTGYGIVRTLEERSDGSPTPRAGSVYPTLQLLADEGLATAEEREGRKRYTLTAAGATAADEIRARPTGAEQLTPRAPERRGAIARAAAQLAQAAALAAQTGTGAQVAETAAVLDDARRRILVILARS